MKDPSSIYNYLIKGSVGPIMLQRCYPTLTETASADIFQSRREAESYRSDVSAPLNSITMINRLSFSPGQAASPRRKKGVITLPGTVHRNYTEMFS